MFLRFSTVAGERGAADAERDVRGFAIKFYTDEGNWDLVGNNTPVFFIRDPLKFPDFIHTQKRDPKTNLRNATAAWDFWSLNPESLHQVTILMSDRGLPQNYRQQHGFGSHTYSFVNDAGERFYVKFHFKSQQGIACYTDGEAAELVGRDRESAQRDLFQNIEQGQFPRWTLKVQVMPEAEAATYHINPFDLTKVWPHADYPLIEVGVLELNKNPRTISPKSNRPRSRRPMWCRASAFRPTRCCRVACSRTATPIATAWASTTIRFPSMRRAARSTASIATGWAGSTAMAAPR